jgi:hypothetical protein
MPLEESGNCISDLDSSNPAATDEVSRADDHLRLIKSVLKASFPHVSGVVNVSDAALNASACQHSHRSVCGWPFSEF